MINYEVVTYKYVTGLVTNQIDLISYLVIYFFMADIANMQAIHERVKHGTMVEPLIQTG